MSWEELIDELNNQLPVIEKMFDDKGLEIVLTCSACPEQYDVFKDKKQVAYLRLRHGEFRIDMPECGEKTVFEAEPDGDGCFESYERISFMHNALEVITNELLNDKQ